MENKMDFPGVNMLGQIDHIIVYRDSNQAFGEFILGRKQESQLAPGYIWVPRQELENIESEVGLPGIPHYKKSSMKYEDYKWICGGSDDIEYYKQVLNKIKNELTESNRNS